jgi:hypothetical protein
MASLPQGRVTNDPGNYLAIGLQSAKDVDATTFYFLKQLDGSGFDVTPAYSSERVGGSGREIGLRYRTKVTADGQYVAYAQPDFAGRVLTAALWQDTVTPGPSQGAGNPFYSTHQINSGASQPLYQTIEQAWADETERVTNCIVSDLKIEGEAGKPVKFTTQFVSGGTSHTQAATLTPVREPALPFMVPGGSVAITATGNLTAGVGATSLQVTKWSVDIKNAVDDAIQTVALNREDVLVLTQDFDIDGTFKYINNSFWNAVQYGGGTQVPTGFLVSGQFTFFTQGPSNQSLTLFAPYVEFTALKVNRLDPDGKTMYLDYTASTKNIGTSSLQATVVSGASTSYALSTT